MKKIVYPILLLVLTACKGNQQTTNNESAAIPVAETIADTIAQPEVDAITSATSKPNQVSFNGRIVLPPQRQATIALTMGGIVKKGFSASRAMGGCKQCNRHVRESGVHHPATNLSGQSRTNRISLS